jgi:hypothetical protein
MTQRLICLGSSHGWQAESTEPWDTPVTDLLVGLADRSPAEPPQFVSSEPRWDVGMPVMIRPGFMYRIVETSYDPEREQTTWVVELVRDDRAA